MNTNVINDEYFENPVLSTDTEKNTIMMAMLMKEYEMIPEYRMLESRYDNWVLDSCCIDFDGASIEEADSWKNRMREIKKELDTFFDGTGITKEEYEEAKKNLYEKQ